MGQERVDSVNQIIDGLIEGGHREAAALAEWKDNINESWADLLEMIDTRAQLLTASYDLLKYVLSTTTNNNNNNKQITYVMWSFNINFTSNCNFHDYIKYTI